MILETSVWVCWEPTKVLHCLVLCAMWGNQKQGMRMISTIFSCPTLGSRFACFIRWWVAPSACCARAHANCGKSDWDQIEQSMSTISTIVQFSPDLVLHVMGGAIHLPQELTPIVSREISRNEVHGWAEEQSCCWKVWQIQKVATTCQTVYFAFTTNCIHYLRYLHSRNHGFWSFH